MYYAKIIDGAVAQYPYPLTQLRNDHPNTSFPQPYELTELAAFDVYEVVDSTPPVFSTMSQRLDEAAPVMVKGVWTRQWQVADLSPAEQAAAVAAIIASVTSNTQARLDTFARTRGYDGILSACTYASSAIPKFAADGQYAVNARDATWATLYAFMADVGAGTKPMPTGFAEVEPLLPALVWPA